jgi:hypothetical protein
MENNILIIPGSGSIEFTGSADSNIRLQVEPSGAVSFYGETGKLFNIADDDTGAIVSINTLNGSPVVEVFDDKNVLVNGSVISDTFEYVLDGATLVTTASITTGVYDATVLVDPSIDSARFSGANIEYTAQRTNAIRSGNIMASWLDGQVSYTDISNNSVGDTSDLSFNVISENGDIRLRAYSAGSGSGEWTIHTLFKLFPNLT